jgi:hypothetical protein
LPLVASLDSEKWESRRSIKMDRLKRFNVLVHIFMQQSRVNVSWNSCRETKQQVLPTLKVSRKTRNLRKSHFARELKAITSKIACTRFRKEEGH